MQSSPFPVWLVYAPSVLFFLLAIAVIARSLFVPSDTRRQPCCGACGHPTTEPLGERCNECGALLARAGVVTPVLVARLRGFLPLALIAWTAACGSLAAHGVNFARVAAWNAAQKSPAKPSKPQSVPVNIQMEMEPQKWVNGFGKVDESKLNFRVQADLQAQVKDGVAESGTLEITIRKNGTSAFSLTMITIPSGAFTTTDRDSTSETKGEKFGEAEAKAALALAGVDTEYKAVNTTVRDIVALVQASIVDPEGVDSMFNGMSGNQAAGSLSAHSISGGGGSYGMSAWNPPQPQEPWEIREVQVGAAVMLVVYITGLVLITWRHRVVTMPRQA